MKIEISAIYQPWELGKKCDDNFILTFAVAKATTAKLFVKDFCQIFLFLVVYQRSSDVLYITLVKTSIKHTLDKVFRP